MEVKTNDVVQPATVPQHTANRIPAAAAPPTDTDSAPRLQVYFGQAEVCRLSGLTDSTLRFWIKRGWVRGLSRGQNGTRMGWQFSAWQAVGITILAAALRSVRGRPRSYIGRTSVLRAMEALEGLDDALLLVETEQDPRVAECIATQIVNVSLTDFEQQLSPQVYENLARVLAALDRKARALRERNRGTRRV